MKTEIRSNYFVSLIFTLLLVSFVSCTKKDETTTKQDTTPGTETTEFSESNEDLLKVNYDYFYKELSPHGEWVEINAKDLGLEIKHGTTQKEGNTFYDFALDVFAVRNAYAQTEEQLFNIFVWRPANEFVSTMVNESPEKQYTPYNNGQWVNTDQGWYFKANTPQEDLTSHYGRWNEDPNLGWVWLPGKVWSPAWVDWRETENEIAWAPLPPGSYIVNDGVKIQSSINDNRYTIVEKKHFIEPSVYKYRYQYVENKNKIMIKEMTKKDGIIIKNKTIINKGPDVEVIEKKTNRKIDQVKIKKVGKKDDAVTEGNTMGVFTPELKEEKVTKKEPVSKPEKLVSYKDAKKITKEEKEELKDQDKQQKEKELKKEEKKSDKEMKKEDKDKDKKKDTDKDKGKKNDDAMKNKGNDDKVKDKQDKGKK
jgi:hypothetical protein